MDKNLVTKKSAPWLFLIVSTVACITLVILLAIIGNANLAVYIWGLCFLVFVIWQVILFVATRLGGGKDKSAVDYKKVVESATSDDDWE